MARRCCGGRVAPRHGACPADGRHGDAGHDHARQAEAAREEEGDAAGATGAACQARRHPARHASTLAGTRHAGDAEHGDGTARSDCRRHDARADAGYGAAGATPAAPATVPGMDMPPAAPNTAADHQAMPGMGAHGAMAMPMAMPGCSGATGDAACRPGAGSGTSRTPAIGGAMHGLHVMTGDWMLMLNGYAWGSYTDQSGPRGRSEAFVTSIGMIEADRGLGGGATLQLRTMLSLDPLMGPRGYPSLLATGETADGVTPLVDRQHPHDLFMEMSARVDVPLGGGVTGFVYGGPVAEPALGPSAFMHRASARYLPLAPISHHWFGSTHISYGVVTAGLSGNSWQIEGSAFRGREPDEQRWDIETPGLDSWSVRATWNPTPNWSAQISHGRLHSPAALEPGVDEARATKSVSYARGGISALAGFAIKRRLPGRALTAWIAEADQDIGEHHSLFGRIENVANDELFPDPLDPLHDRPFRVTRAELGYAYRVPISDVVELALGGSGFVLLKPSALDASYGRMPTGFSLFAKLSLGH